MSSRLTPRERKALYDRKVAKRAAALKAALKRMFEQAGAPNDDNAKERFLRALEELFARRKNGTIYRLDGASWKRAKAAIAEAISETRDERALARFLDICEAILQSVDRNKLIHILLESASFARECGGLSETLSDELVERASRVVGEGVRKLVAAAAQRDEADFRSSASIQTWHKLAAAFHTTIKPDDLAAFASAHLAYIRASLGPEPDWAKVGRNLGIAHRVRELVALSTEQEGSGLHHRFDSDDAAFLITVALNIGQARLALPLATTGNAPKHLGRLFVRTALELKPPETRTAYICMTECKLEDEFPGLLRDHRTRMLKYTIEKERISEGIFHLRRYGWEWDLVAMYVAELAGNGQHFLARLVLERAGLASDERLAPLIDDAICEQQAAERRRDYLSFDPDMEAKVLFVADALSASTLCDDLRSLPPGAVLGLDSEWRPSTYASGSLSSIIQLATRDRAYVLDLLWMDSIAGGAHCDALDKALASVFQRRDVFKVGFGFSGDIKILAGSHPRMIAWKRFDALVDLQHIHLLRAVSSDTAPEPHAAWEVGYRKCSHGGLADLVKLVLGKQLCKIEQMSDWNIRPLRHTQLVYAALDAFCLVQVFDRVFPRGVPPDAFVFFNVGVGRHGEAGTSAAPHAAKTAARADVAQVPAYASAKEANESPQAVAFDEVEQTLVRLCTERTYQFERCEPGESPKPMSDVAIVGVSHPTGASVKEAARLLGVELACVLKSMSYMVETDAGWAPVVVCLRGDCFVDEGKLSGALLDKPALASESASRRFRRATPAECESFLGYKVGAIGPVALRGPARVLLDASVLEQEPSCSGTLYCGVGSPSHLLLVRSGKILKRLVQAEVCDVATPPRKRKSSAEAEGGRSRAASAGAPGAAPADGEEAGSSGDSVTPPPRFIVDNMLGRLGKMLRIVGIDCMYASDVVGKRTSAPAQDFHAHGPDRRSFEKRKRYEARRREIADILRAAREQNRVFLTTDRKALANSRSVRICVLDNLSGRRAQFKELSQRFGFALEQEEFLSRCVKCNNKGFDFVSTGEIARKKVLGEISESQVPAEVLRKMNRFYRCKSAECATIYWEGPKFDHCVKNYEFLFADGPSSEASSGEDSEACGGGASLSSSAAPSV